MADPLIPVEDAETQAMEARLEQLQKRKAALTAEVEKARLDVLRNYRDQHAARFADVKWKAALAGASVVFPVKLPGMTANIRVPTGADVQAVNAFIMQLNTPPLAGDKAATSQYTEMRAACLPITDDESELLARLMSVQAEGAPLLDLASLDIAARLRRLRTLSTLLLRRISDDAKVIEGWLNAQLELELGN